MRELIIAFGLFLFILGLIVEIVADLQKTKFRSIPTNKEKFISTGLWSKSRHPNYVGEITLWFGISIMSFSNLNGLKLFRILYLSEMEQRTFLEKSRIKFGYTAKNCK